MNSPSNTLPIAWTWADMISSYRFWGLLMFMVLFMLAQQLLSIFAPIHITQVSSWGAQGVGVLLSVKFVSMTFGFLLAWICLRGLGVHGLLVCALIYLVGASIFCLLLTQDSERLWLIAGLAMIGLATGAVMLLVPAFIAEGRGTAEVFVIIFGIVIMLQMLTLMPYQSAYGIFMDFMDWPATEGRSSPFWLFSTIPAVIGCLFLVPVARTMFAEAPPVRSVEGARYQPVDPFVVFFLSFIPFYGLYWIYRAHKEIRVFSQSPRLLTPAASVWTQFVPLMFPITVTTLADEANELGKSRGLGLPVSTPLLIVWALFMPFIALAYLQAKLNRLYANV